MCERIYMEVITDNQIFTKMYVPYKVKHDVKTNQYLRRHESTRRHTKWIGGGGWWGFERVSGSFWSDESWDAPVSFWTTCRKFDGSAFTKVGCECMAVGCDTVLQQRRRLYRETVMIDGFVKEGYKHCWHKKCSTVLQQYHVLFCIRMENGECVKPIFTLCSFA